MDLRDSLKLAPESDFADKALYCMGLAFSNMGDYAHAAPCFSRAYGIRKKCIHYCHERAKAYQMIGRVTEAVEDFNSVIRRQPNNANAFFRRGFAHKSLGMFSEAAEDFEKAKKLDPNNAKLIVNYKKIYNTECIVLCKAGEEDDSGSREEDD